MKKERIAVYAEDEGENLSMGYRMAEEVLARANDDGVKLSVVGVLPECRPEYAERTESLHRFSMSIGAEMDVLYSSNPVLALINYIKRKRISEVIMGDSRMAAVISEVLPNVKLSLISQESVKVCSFVPIDLLCCTLSER